MYGEREPCRERDGTPKRSSANREMGPARICSADEGVGKVGRKTAREGQGQG